MELTAFIAHGTNIISTSSTTALPLGVAIGLNASQISGVNAAGK